MQSTIRPGQPWLDTDGKRIQAAQRVVPCITFRMPLWILLAAD